jgi:hypothetical protein
MLVLLMGIIYEVHHWDGHRWHGMHTMLHEVWYGHSDNIDATSRKFAGSRPDEVDDFFQFT